MQCFLWKYAVEASICPREKKSLHDKFNEIHFELN
jgi:hypothetical protein